MEERKYTLEEIASCLEVCFNTHFDRIPGILYYNEIYVEWKEGKRYALSFSVSTDKDEYAIISIPLEVILNNEITTATNITCRWRQKTTTGKFSDLRF